MNAFIHPHELGDALRVSLAERQEFVTGGERKRDSRRTRTAVVAGSTGLHVRSLDDEAATDGIVGLRCEGVAICIVGDEPDTVRMRRQRRELPSDALT